MPQLDPAEGPWYDNVSYGRDLDGGYGYESAGRRLGRAAAGTVHPGIQVLVIIWIAGLILLVHLAQSWLAPSDQVPAHDVGARRLPPHVVRATSLPGLWVQL